MKRVAHIIWGGVVALAMLLTGCVLGHDVTTNKPVELRCSPVMSQRTRTTNTDGKLLFNTFPTEADFGLWAYALPRDKQWEVFSPDAEPFVENGRFLHNTTDGLWYPTPSLQWDYNQQLTLAACSPYIAGASFDPENGVVIGNYDTEANPNEELLYSHLMTNRKAERSMSGVELYFYHALAKVDVRMKTTLTESHSLYVKSVTFKNIHTEGAFCSLPNPTWYPTEKLADVCIYSADDEGWPLPDCNNQIVGGDAARLVMPQAMVTDIVVVADVLRGGMIVPEVEFVVEKATIIWEAGKYYTYTFSLTDSSLRLEGPMPESFKAEPQAWE